MSAYFISPLHFYLVCMFYAYCISGVMVSVFEENVVDCAFGPRSGQTKDKKRCLLLLR